MRRAIVAVGHTDTFRIVHFNLLSNHLHLIVEADGAEALAHGMQRFAIRVARQINAAHGRRGALFSERYHARTLSTPREVRHALRYVICNLRHHAAQRGDKLARTWIDPFSSAAWFDGWREPIRTDEPAQRERVRQPQPTASPTVWVLTTGWKKWGLLSFDEVPAS